MRISLLAFTDKGGQYALDMAEGLREGDHSASVYIQEKYCERSATAFTSVYKQVADVWEQSDALIFIGASGIAVRSIAPLLQGKDKDPAVLVCDERRGYVIPLLSGHIGGANSLAMEIAGITGVQPVITTATDINDVFSADSWAVQSGMAVINPGMIKEISARLLHGQKVGFASDYPVKGDLPKGLEYGLYEYGVYIGAKGAMPFGHTLLLAPKNCVAGIGCRRGTTAAAIETAVGAAMDKLNLNVASIKKICSIDIKADEQGLLEYAERKRLPLCFYSAEQLGAVPGEFSGSEYVQQITGVDNVCERSAVLGGGAGRLIGRKLALGGVTVAVFIQDFEVVFP